MHADHALGMRHRARDLAHRERGSVGGQNALRRGVCGERRENLLLDLHAFGNRFDHDLRAPEAAQLGVAAEAVQRGIGLMRTQAPALQSLADLLAVREQ